VARKRHYSVLGRSLSENDVKETRKLRNGLEKGGVRLLLWKVNTIASVYDFFVNAGSNAIGCTPKDPFFSAV
jgi:hypothetical protein